MVLSFILLAITQTACKDQNSLVVADPVFNPPFGTVAKGTRVTITCKTEGAEIWYTTNGTTPQKGPPSIKYTGPFIINATTTIKAIAVKDGWTSSNVKKAEGVYTISTTSGGGGGYSGGGYTGGGTKTGGATSGGGGTPGGSTPGGGTVVVTPPVVPTYAITMQDDGNGTATASPNPAAVGATVTITATKNVGYHFSSWTVVSGGVTLSNASANSADFTMPAAAVTIKANFTTMAPNTPCLTLSPVSFAAVTYGQTGHSTTETKTVTITNIGTGTGDAHVSGIALSGADAASFTLGGTLTPTIPAAGGTATFTVERNASLPAGTHTANITVTYDSGAAEIMTVLFTVNKAAGAAVSGLPTVSGATASSITVSAVTVTIPTNPGSQIIEYAISTAADGTGLVAWQTGTTFSGVTPNTTTYYVYARSKDNGDYAAGTTLAYSAPIFTYTVIFNSNGGTGSMGNQTLPHGLAQALTTNAFTRTSYSFTGWDTASSGTTVVHADGVSVSNLASTPGATVNLYAVWGHTHAYTWVLKPVTSPVTASNAVVETATCTICGDTSPSRSKSLTAYLASLPCETNLTSPYTIKFAGTSDAPFPGTNTAFNAAADFLNPTPPNDSSSVTPTTAVSPVGEALKDNPTKSVKLDFSNCSFTTVPDYALCIRTSTRTGAGPSYTYTPGYAGLPSLVEVDLPSAITAIGQYAFTNCTNLKGVNGPTTVTLPDKRKMTHFTQLQG